MNSWLSGSRARQAFIAKRALSYCCKEYKRPIIKTNVSDLEHYTCKFKIDGLGIMYVDGVYMGNTAYKINKSRSINGYCPAATALATPPQ